jgi:hypothetical protein
MLPTYWYLQQDIVDNLYLIFLTNILTSSSTEAIGNTEFRVFREKNVVLL